MKIKSEHRDRQSDVCWQKRSDMVLHALRRSLPWFVFVNVSFALMVLLRGALFGDISETLPAARELLPWLDGGMLSIVAAALLLLLLLLRGNPDGYISRWLPGLLLCGMSLVWSAGIFGFVVLWQLPLGWPLVCVLLLSGLTALYYKPEYLLSYIGPLWLALPFISHQLNQVLNTRFVAVWLILTVVLIYGRFNLQRWFDEAWVRYAENQQLIGRLSVLTHQDALTGVANRRALDQHLSLLSTQQSACALLMLDVDFFKRYNDRYGHQAGDTCLRAVADALRKSVRKPQDFIGRYGGEEFVVVLSGAGTVEAESVAGRIRLSLQNAAIPHAGSDVSGFVTVSTGLASSSPGWSAEQMIARADEALYRAKRNGRDRWSS